jgi:hypothetical protein
VSCQPNARSWQRQLRACRRSNHPCVGVSAPEEEVDQGTLPIRAIEFRLGAITVTGAKTSEAIHVGMRVRLKPGAGIDSARLLQDLDWLGCFPFRRITPDRIPVATRGIHRTTKARNRQGVENSGRAE